MNIIQVCPYDLSIPGGVQTHVAHLSNQLAQGNHNVIVFSPVSKNFDTDKNFDCPLYHITDSKRIKIYGTSTDISYMSKSEKTRTRKIISEFKPDVIHFHAIWNPFMQFQLLHMTDDSIKKIATFHDTPPDAGIGKLLGGNLMKLGVHYYVPKLDEIISVSETQLQAMGNLASKKRKNVHIIPNGIDASLREKYRSPGNSDADIFKLIFIGRLEERKGVFDLLKVYKRISREKLNKEVSLTIIGHGPQTEDVIAFIKKHDLKNVILHQKADDDQKFSLLSKSDLMISPALYGESFGIVLLEAMAMGIKVAAYGNKGYLTLGRNYGVENFPEPGDKKGLFKLIKKHIEQPEEFSHLKEKGMEIARNHDWEKVTSAIQKVYEQL